MIRKTAITILSILIFACVSAAHPLGNFTVNHYVRIAVGAQQVNLRYIVDMAEIPAYQELRAISAHSEASPTSVELTAYGAKEAVKYAEGLHLSIDGAHLPLRLSAYKISTPAGAGGLSTLRLECDYTATIETGGAAAYHQLILTNRNHVDRSGWQEIVVTSTDGITIFNSTAFANGITDELKAYPEDLLQAPLNERRAELSFTRATLPAGAQPLKTRNGRAVEVSRDRLAELIAVPQLTPGIAVVGLLFAMMLGALHALSPGHGKTIVGAYLVGSRGTAKHAAFLGLTVTVTHTAGVFALGIITLFAARYIVPERIFPILSFVSGAVVVAIGLSLFINRIGEALGYTAYTHSHNHGEGDKQGAHSHLPPEGSDISWRSLLMLGISGGLLPCPSALVVLLSAISLQRIGYGLLLVVSFSIGLASVLTGIGLLFLYARRFVDRPRFANGRLVRILPVVSALVIICVGTVICYQGLTASGLNLSAIIAAMVRPNLTTQSHWLSTVSVLALGFVLGLKHALEADHVAAVTIIASESKSLFSSSIVGALWGVGHTISLFIAGLVVILLNVEIGERLAMALEFSVGLMLIGLGAAAIIKIVRNRNTHIHVLETDGKQFVHTHWYFNLSEQLSQVIRNPRPIIVGMVHGFAGSAALMLLVAITTPSPFISLLYIVIFGVGTIAGMLLMSIIVGVSVHLTAARFARVNLLVRALAGAFSFAFGIFMVYKIGFVEHLIH